MREAQPSKGASPSTLPGLDLLQTKWFTRFIKSSTFPLGFQVFNLVAVTALVAVGYGVTTEAARYTNLASFVVWVVWWPSVIAVTLVAARAWCAVCHLRLIADWTGRVGLHLRIPDVITKHGPFPAAMVLGLMLLHSTVVSYDIHHFAGKTAVYLVVLFAYATAISLLFGPKSFCKHFCPLSPLFGSYSRLSPTELRVADRAKCVSCRTKECVKSCPNDLYPGNLDSNAPCLLCFECAKRCPGDNIRFSVRAPCKDVWAPAKGLGVWETITVVILLGIVFEELGEEWGWIKQALTCVPNLLLAWGVPGQILGSYRWVDSVWLNLVLPLLLLCTTAFATRLLNRGGSSAHYLKTYSVCLLPLIFSLHLSKMCHELNGRGGYVQYVVADPVGLRAASQFSSGTIVEPSPALLNHTAEGWSLMLIVAAGFVTSLFCVSKRSRKSGSEEIRWAGYSVLPFYVLICVLGPAFLLTVYNWFGL